MKKNQFPHAIYFVMWLMLICSLTIVANATAPVDLGSDTSFAALAGSSVTVTGGGEIWGNIGVSPGSAFTPGNPPVVVHGNIYLAVPIAAQAEADLTAAYNDAAGRPTNGTLGTELGGTSPLPGVYNSAAGTFGITGTLTLDAMGNSSAVWIFQAASTLITADGSQVILAGGASVDNVYWQVGSSATLGTNSDMKGQILAQASITSNTGAKLTGRALARVGAVTLDDPYDSITTVGTSTTPPPNAGFFATQTSGVGPLTVNFIDTSANNPTSWTWNFGDGSTSFIQFPTHQYQAVSAPTTYTVRLIVSNAFGTSTMTKLNYIYESVGQAPIAGFYASQTSGVGPFTTNFFDTSANNPSNWIWSFGDGSTSNSQSPLHTYQAVSAPTTYTVQLIVSNMYGASTNTKLNYIYVSNTVGLAPIAGFFAIPTSGIGPFTTNFVDTSTNLPSSWAWNFGDGNTSNIQNPSHQYQAVSIPTTYTVRLIVINSFGASTNTKLNYIYVSNIVGLAPIAGFYASPTSGVGPFTTNFVDTSANNPTSWAWNFGDGGTDTIQYPFHQYQAVSVPTTYTVQLIVSNSFGTSTNIQPNYIYVSNTVGLPPVAGFYGTPTTGIGPYIVNFTDTSANFPSSWAWDFGDGNTSNLQSPFHQYQAVSLPTTYTVQLIVSNVIVPTVGINNGAIVTSGTSTSIKLNYIYVSNTVGLAPNAGFFATQTSGDGPFTTNFIDTSTNNPTSWAWDFGDGGSSNIQYPSHQYQDLSVPTTYTVQLIASNTFGSSTSTEPEYIYVITTTGASPPFVYNPPSLKVYIGNSYGLTSIFNIEDFNTGGLGTSYSIPTDFLSLGSMGGSYENQGAYTSATSGTNTYQITNDGGSSSASGKVKYSTYKIYKLPKVGLTAGTSWDVNVASYTHNTSGIALPPSFGNQGALVISDVSNVTAYWVNNSVVRITSLHYFIGARTVDVIASPVSAPPFGSDIDKERIYVYNNLISNGTFSSASDTTVWSPMEIPYARTVMASQQWLSSYTDAAGTQANGVWKFTFADANGGVKSTPKVSNWLSVDNGQWYIVRMRVVADAANNHQSILFGYSNYVGAGLQTDIAANVLFGIPTTWTWQETALYVHGSLTTGYPQFQFIGGGAGSVYVDDLQIINAAPTLVDVNRYFTRLHYPYGDFTSSSVTTGWAAQLYPGAGSLPGISVSNGALNLDFSGAGSGSNQKGFKWTANNGIQGNAATFAVTANGIATFPVITDREVGVRATFFKQSGNFNSLGLVLVAAFGVQSSGQQNIGQSPSNLLATAGVGIFPGGTYRTVASAVNGYYQFQFGARSDQPGVLIVTNLDFDRDQDDPNFGDPNLFP